MLARSAENDALFLADEDHQALRRIALPVDLNDPIVAVPLPGRPAQVLALHGKILVTVRDPGLLLELVPSRSGFTESRRLALPADAWGIAVSADQKTAVVSSAWTHRLTGVDLESMRARWSIDVAREPRGIAITESGAAYVSHLVGSELTKVNAIDGASPVVTRIALPPSPGRTPRGAQLGASLGYALAVGPRDSRLFVARHALGGEGFERWFGAPTVDVLLTRTDTPLAPNRSTGTARWEEDEWTESARVELLRDVDGSIPLADPKFVQPRAVVYRRSTDTVLVAGEGQNTLVELDALALDPSLHEVQAYGLAAFDTKIPENDPHARVVVSGGAPSAIALSDDESIAFVYARSTNDLVVVRLADRNGKLEPGPKPMVHLADDTLSADARKGKRLFYDATDPTMSGGLACSGCHPDGRDDGFVWSELGTDDTGVGRSFRGMATQLTGFGVPRQTPMLAGRVAALGPYGWHAESKTLEDRIRDGFGIHRWSGGSSAPTMDRPKAIAAFLREGLVAPAHEERVLTEQEQRGKTLFEGQETGCTTCHLPERELTDRAARTLPRKADVFGFATEDERAFKTPSLFFVGGTPPYFHDGRAKTLEELVDLNGDVMGHTSGLVREDRSALVAYLKTL